MYIGNPYRDSIDTSNDLPRLGYHTLHCIQYTKENVILLNLGIKYFK